MDARSQAGPRATELFEFRHYLIAKLSDVVRPAVGQRLLGLIPHAFIGIQFRGVSRKALHLQPRMSLQEVPDWFSSMDLSVVPNHDDNPAKMTQQMP